METVSVLETFDEVLPTFTALPRADEGTPIEFRIIPMTNYILSSNIRLHLQFEVHRIDATGAKHNITMSADKVCINTYTLNTMWKSIDVFVNGRIVTPNNTCQPYIALIRAFRKFSKDAPPLELLQSIWWPDRADSHNDYEMSDANTGFTNRRSIIDDGERVDLTGPLMVDIFQQPQAFPDDCEILLRLNRASREFLFNGIVADKENIQLTIHSADLCLTRMKTDINLYRSVGSEIGYPYIGYEAKYLVINKDLTTESREIFEGTLPISVTLLMVKQTAFNGNYAKNPFEFNHNHLKTIQLQLNANVLIPTQAYTMGSKTLTSGTRKAYNFSRLYSEMMTAFKNKPTDEIINDITYDDFRSGFAVFCFDLRNDRNPRDGQIINQPEGVLKLLLEFHVALAEPVVLVILLEYQKMVAIKPNGGEIKQITTTI